MATFIAELTLTNFGPVKQGTLRLSPLHALIGPNDAGKSTVLRAVRLLSAWAREWSPSNSDIAFLRPGFMLRAACENQVQWAVRGKTAQSPVEEGHAGAVNAGPAVLNGRSAILQGAPYSGLAQLLRGVQVLRLDPDDLRAPTALLTDEMPLAFTNDRGKGLGSLLDAVFSRSVANYLALEGEVRSAFPAVAGFNLKTTKTGRTVGVKLTDGTVIGPEEMSEGMLYFLAFALLRLLQGTTVLLLEEPENGLHPSRIAEVMRMVRKLSATTQILIATHSPLVINELEPSEVTVVTRTVEAGTQFTPIAETPNFKARSKVYALGELWLSYANGTDEAPLLHAGDGDASEDLPRG